MDLKII